MGIFDDFVDHSCCPWAVFQHSGNCADRELGPSITYLRDNDFGFLIDFGSSESIFGKDLIPNKNSIGFGDVAATARITSTLANLNKSYELRYGDDIAVSDLQSSPVILIGGFSNPWAMRLTAGLRYTLEQGDRIVDHKDKGRSWRTGVPQADYALITRIVDQGANGTTLVIAGIDTYGNQAGADFVSDPERRGKLLRTAPANWQRMNTQIVLHTNMINGVPVSTEVQALHFS